MQSKEPPIPALCFVIHGIGPHEPGFSDPLQRGIHRHLLNLIQTKANEDSEKWTNIKPADLVDFQTLYWANIGSDEQNNLYQKIYPDFFGAEGRVTKTRQLVTDLAPIRNLSITLIGDIFSYLGRFQEAIRRQVFDQLANKLRHKSKAGVSFSIILVGHSLGSVILHDLISGFLRYRYANFNSLLKTVSVFTMGSPLSLFSLVAESAHPDQFAKWINFLHPRDPIAFPMARIFPKTVEDVELPKLSWNPLKLHALYWHHDTVHQKIANQIFEHVTKGYATSSSLSSLGNVPPEIFQPFHSAVARAGFSRYFPDFEKVPFGDVIPIAKQIDICHVYGGHWTQGNAQYFVQALCNSETTVRVCMLSPKSPSIPGFCHHFSDLPEDELRGRIERGHTAYVNILTEARRRVSNPGRLQIYHSLNVVNHSFYRCDDVIYFTPRQLASNRMAASHAPSLLYRNTSGQDDYFSWLIRDFQLLIATSHDAVLFYDSAIQSSIDKPPTN